MSFPMLNLFSCFIEGNLPEPFGEFFKISDFSFKDDMTLLLEISYSGYYILLLLRDDF